MVKLKLGLLPLGRSSTGKLTIAGSGSCIFCHAPSSSTLMHVVTCRASLTGQRQALMFKCGFYGPWEFTQFLFSGQPHLLQDRLQYAADLYDEIVRA